ncbi:hypothetical protein [Litchfieldella xinjiangensis]|uniref:hypothetical protein n=1 Tax=Litchfieldella xinjiangensis TaxID=1166948 RepID=UPI000A5048AC|nr:hypothetical protein [Halomonas xinjiangensis]
MTEQYLSLTFSGYWRDSEANQVPEEAGLYCVFSCRNDTEEDGISVQKLLYVGISRNVRHRITHHDDKPHWESYLGEGESLCYSIAPVSHIYRERCQAAMIHAHQPPANQEYRDAFPFDATRLSLHGKTRLLKSSLQVPA